MTKNQIAKLTAFLSDCPITSGNLKVASIGDSIEILKWAIGLNGYQIIRRNEVSVDEYTKRSFFSLEKNGGNISSHFLAATFTQTSPGRMEMVVTLMEDQ